VSNYGLVVTKTYLLYQGACGDMKDKASQDSVLGKG
jgi:hypothetical protein